MARKIKEIKEQKKIKELEEKLVRALADYQNLVKRFDKEKEEITSRANKNLLRNLLPVLDILEMAQKHLGDQGLGMAITQFENALEQSGTKEIKVEVGEKFDEEKHEATEVSQGGETGTIASVLRKGYKWRDGAVLRPTQVKVYDGRLEKDKEKELDKELQRGDYV